MLKGVGSHERGWRGLDLPELGWGGKEKETVGGTSSFPPALRDLA